MDNGGEAPQIIGVKSGVRPLLVLHAVSKTYSSGVEAVSNISLKIAERSFVSLLGPSGCGKTTILRLVANLLQPSSGAVLWPQSDADDMSAGDIGFVFQEPTLMPWQTVFGNVYLPLRLQGISEDAARERVMDMIDAVGLSEFASAYPRDLSGGMKMRVSIARALVTKPRLLLMDEPFAALDEITRHRLNDDLLGLWEASGVTIIFVTHSVYESAYLADRIVVMRPRPGRIFKDMPLRRGAAREKDYRLSTRYHDICREVSHAMHDASEGRGA